MWERVTELDWNNGQGPPSYSLYIPPQLEKAVQIEQSRHGPVCLSSKDMTVSETSHFQIFSHLKRKFYLLLWNKCGMQAYLMIEPLKTLSS